MKDAPSLQEAVEEVGGRAQLLDHADAGWCKD
jgi:hypothetical protein